MDLHLQRYNEQKLRHKSSISSSCLKSETDKIGVISGAEARINDRQHSLKCNKSKRLCGKS